MIGVLYYVSRFGTYRSQWVRARRPLNRFLRVRVLASFHHLVSSSSVLNECPFCGVTTRLESLFLSSRDAPRAPLSSVTRRRSARMSAGPYSGKSSLAAFARVGAVVGGLCYGVVVNGFTGIFGK